MLVRDQRPADIPERLIRIGEPAPLRRYLRSMWERRDFIATVPLGQLRAQNQNTVLGSAWHLLNPLFLAAVYYIIFAIILPGGRLGYDNYAGFLTVGIFAFQFLNKGIMAGTRTVTSNLPLIQQINFPRAALPVSAVLVETIAQVTSLVALFGVVWITGTPPSLGWFQLIPILLIQAVFLLGCCFIVARATFHFRDVEQLLPYLIRLWMYLSGLFFALDKIVKAADARGAPWLVTLFEWNPAWLFMALWRHALIGDIGPVEEAPRTGERVLAAAPGWYWAAASAWAVVAVTIGFFWFRLNEAEYSRGV